MTTILIACGEENYQSILSPHFDFNETQVFDKNMYENADYYKKIFKCILEASYHRDKFESTMHLKIESDDKKVETEFVEVEGIFMCDKYEDISFQIVDDEQKRKVGDIIAQAPHSKINITFFWGM